MKVYLIGAGMGNPDTLTLAAQRAIETSDLLIGAQRLIDSCGNQACEKLALIRSADIVDALAKSSARQASVLFSGDVGFYSGATVLCEKLEGTDVDIEVIPGISSLVYFCARLHTTWEDAALVSAHGREHNAMGVIQSHRKTFCITGGQTKVNDICRQLVDRGLGDLRAAAGERLSYDDERIVRGKVADLASKRFENLSVLLVENDRPVRNPYAAPSLPDTTFERGHAPMTKEEVRALVISKLRIASGHVIWDVGAGTGSVSVEAARAACEGTVFAIERKPDAVMLLHRTKEVHRVPNMVVVGGEAPAVLEGLPTPDRVFIGGSSGNVDAIVDAALSANPGARICATAVTLETLSDLIACVKDRQIPDADIVQVSVARADEVGSYHLMRAENPVYIVTFEGHVEGR